jgi:hypothetical protein
MSRTSKYCHPISGDFEKDFEFPFGDKRVMKVIFAERYKWRDKHYRPIAGACPTDINGHFDTPNHVVGLARLGAGTDLMIAGPRVLIVADHPNPEIGDEGIVGVRHYLQGKTDGSLDMFVNDSSTDPAPPWHRDSTQREPYQKARDTWLKPGTRYYYRLYRLETRPDGKHPPLFLNYYGSGPGEKEIHYHEAEAPPHISEAIPMVIGGVQGHWVPDE